MLQKLLLYEPWYFLIYYISTLAIRLYLGAYFKVFVLISTPWFDMFLEPSLTIFLHHRKRSFRIFTLTNRLYLGAYFKVFVLIFTPWFDMLLELSLTTFLQNPKMSLRIVTPNTMRTIVSQVESMIDLCTFIACWIVIMLMLVLNLCNDCNDLVGCAHNLI